MAALVDVSRARSLRGIWGALIYLGMVAGGGLVLGLVTGVALAWLLRREPVRARP
jgi:NhaP-type Na+/H+ or K+/H+ antiporter